MTTKPVAAVPVAPSASGTMPTVPSTTAILFLDIQQGLFQSTPECEVVVPKAIQVAEFGRKHGMTIIHVGLGYEPGYPEIPVDHPTFGRIRDNNLFVKGSPSSEVPAALKKPTDITLFKHRYSAFSGNSLDMILRAKGIRTLVLMGISTSGIVLSTVRQAFDLDYRSIVIKDACFDPDPEVHRVLLEKVFTRQATVKTADEFMTSNSSI